MQKRQLILLSGEDQWLTSRISHKIEFVEHNQYKGVYLYQKDTAPLLQKSSKHLLYFPFQLAKNMLGQEYQWIIFDIRFGFNLEALAIVAGTLKAGGKLCLLTNHWQEFTAQKDLDSQRWADGNIIQPHHFFHFFKQKFQQYQFPIFEQDLNPYSDMEKSSSLKINAPEVISPKETKYQLTEEQQQVLVQILKAQVDIFVITAKRGRGKSALAGFLTEQLLNEDPLQLLVTAPNKKSIEVLQRFSSHQIPFMAPDALLERLTTAPDSVTAKWLIIDEAAMIPLPMLEKLLSFFAYVVCTTTVQSYEGTGRGFLLKLMQKMQRPCMHFELEKPLRWVKNDPVEKFIEDVLFLEEFNSAKSINIKMCNAQNQFGFYTQQKLIQKNLLKPFYQLLTLAHYRTSPSDLRRLFDGKEDLFFLAKKETELLGGIWAIQEGNIQDLDLIKAIQQGKRRPRGNLVAQLVSQYSHLEEACLLNSARISRIVIHPQWQSQGIGSQLVTDFCQQLAKEEKVDFISVSFGFEEQLMQFWQKLGFQLVYVSDNQIASSGCYSVVALYGLTAKGSELVTKAKNVFERNLPFIQHPLKSSLQFYLQDNVLDDRLNAYDVEVLHNFAFYHRPLFSSLPSIIRFLKQNNSTDFPILKLYLKDPESIKNYPSYKQWLSLCRQEIGAKLKAN